MSNEATTANAAGAGAGAAAPSIKTAPPGGNESKNTTGEQPKENLGQPETKNESSSPITPEGGKPTGTVTPHTAPEGMDVNKEGKQPTGGNNPSTPGPTAAPPESKEKGNQAGQEKGSQTPGAAH
jgi:hypothetical protein